MNPSAPNRQSWSRLDLARREIELHTADKVRLDRLAEIAGLSRYHFIRAFARQFGLTPHDYQIHLRIGMVQLLLKEGAVVDPTDFGFVDRSHLNRHFNRIVGTTALRYAEQVRRPQ